MRWHILAAAALAAAALAACGDPDTCLPDCEASRSYDAIAYHLRGSLDWDARALAAEERITVVLGGGPVIELDARVAVEGVWTDSEELGFAHDAERGLLRVDLGPAASDAGDGGELTFTVRYRAAASPALVFAGPRDDDPVLSRVAYSNSEPDRARRWLISNDHPSDRAVFSIELEVPAGEDVIANGERVTDGEAGGRRTVGYAMAEPLPTYLMAFAAGELDHAENKDGRVPLAVWYRRGAAVDAGAHLATNANHMAAFEALIGPYPFARYAVVLLPGFPGGMENATITFNSESSGQGAINEVLNAHELAHQWFGDWITMRDYRDAWIKEGMATLLAAEAGRPARDTAGAGRLFGASFGFLPGDAIIDDELSGLDRYTSGPYERAAWMLTQVRARIGEAAFFGTLREVLAAHALDSVDSEAFVRAFAPHLGEAATARWLAALTVHDVPGIDIAVAGQTVTLKLADPAALLLDSIALTVVDGAGAVTARALAPGAPLVIDVPPGGYLAPDERDVHPTWSASFAVDPDQHAQLATLLAPGAAGALAAWQARSAAAQERALALTDLPGLGPAALPQVHSELDSSLARRTLVLDGCRALAALPEGDPEIAAWSGALAPLVASPGSFAYLPALGSCTRAVSPELRAELTALADQGAAISAAHLGRLEHLLGFDYGAADTLAIVGRVATSAPSIRHRDLALDRLTQQVRPPFSGVPAASLDAYRAFFRARLGRVTSGGRLLALWRGIVGVRALDALPDVAALLHKVRLDPSVQRRIVCDAFAIGDGTPAWPAFQAAAEPRAELSAEAAEALADPTVCGL
ncbi:MAG TPA: M1 family aminopeptidase [Kofleriaceae bacterium]|nr:M1 family aminopeptidase [Kofleriaceae bacterium]